jgi:hypothetical protein
MDADHDQFLPIVLTKSTQLRDVVMTIDSAKGPKFQQDQLAAHPAQGQRAGGVEPVARRGKFWGIDLATKRLDGHGFSLRA